MEAEEWWKPDKFDVIDSQSNVRLDSIREKLKRDPQLRALYGKAKNRFIKQHLIQIPVVIRPRNNNVDQGDVVVIGDVVTWPEGTAEKTLQGEFRAASAVFRIEKKRKREKSAKVARFRHHTLMQISIQQAEAQGQRPNMEDRYIIHLFNDIAVFGIFDGHGGQGAADYVANALIPCLRAEFNNALAQDRQLMFTDSNPQPPDAIEKETIKAMKQSLMDAIAQVELQTLEHLGYAQDFSGTTLCVCLCTRSTLIVATLGDSKVYVSRNGVAKQVTVRDHSAQHNKGEKERIELEGGFVNKEGYLGGLVQVSRALGDIDPGTSRKVLGLSATPEILELQLDKEKDEFILVACDGLWDVMAGQTAINLVRTTLKATRGDMLRAAEGLVERAMELKTTDNVTVVIAFLPAANRVWSPFASTPPPSADDENRPRLFRRPQNATA